MSRKFYSFPGSKHHVIVEVAEGVPVSTERMRAGAKELFGSSADEALEPARGLQPIECTFRPGEEPDRENAEASPECSGMWFWLQ